MDQRFDLVIIGSGAAGSEAAEAAYGRFGSIAVVERDRLGGDCPNYACVPTKALLRVAKVLGLLRRAAEFGLRAGEVAVDWDQVRARNAWIVAHTGAASARERYRQRGVTVLDGEAVFEDAHRLRVAGRIVRGEHILIATGSAPEWPAIDGIDAARPITSIQAIALPALPERLIILGGGPVGCEFAQLFSAFGVRVTLVQSAPSLLPREEPELGEVVRELLAARGVQVLTGARPLRLARDPSGHTCVVQCGEHTRELRADEVLVAVGREARTGSLNLAAAGLGMVDGRLQVDDCLRTTRPHIFAAGDVVGPLRYTHFASYQGRLAVENMVARSPRPADYRVVPHVTFTDPELAAVGWTEAEAHRQGREVVTGMGLIGRLGKALVDSEPHGLVKLVADAGDGELLGGHVAAPVAGELVHELAAALRGRMTVGQLAGTMHAYPSYAEAVRDAASACLAQL